ncbi:putative Eukaryotic translation initiation factor 3 subunit B [Blattamonas nauphoetae]|uniref:Eukaryotic translation initiation factor 3 subunit B n=1 Tax=Blattamonas nauphoetae TaxID=2049346 RepID=A0ABQ9XNV7_9EUKA|nr:putative Eukaryotic translation initiation factor 3 subunit B [Blattamonas nauphoetae]
MLSSEDFKVNLDEPILEFENTIAVFGLPTIEEAKKATFMKYLRTYIPTMNDGDVYMPFNDDKKSKGFAFITCPNAAKAAEAIDAFTKPKEKKKKFSAVPFTSFLEIEQLPDEYAPREPPPFHERKGLQEYMMTDSVRSVFLEYRSVGSQYMEFDPLHGITNTLEIQGDEPPLNPTWSPLGTYLSNNRPEGVEVRGGPHLDVLLRLPHPRVQFHGFSPKDNYLLTFSENPEDGPQMGRPVIWRLDTMEQFTFPFAVNMRSNPVRWSGDEQWLAFADVDTGDIEPEEEEEQEENNEDDNQENDNYEQEEEIKAQKKLKFNPYLRQLNDKGRLVLVSVPSMEVTIIPLPNIRYQLSWSPSTKPLLALWTEGYTSPSQIRIYNARTEQFDAIKTVFDARTVQFMWSGDGKMLAAVCDIATVAFNEKGKVTDKVKEWTIEIFRCGEKNIPIESLPFREAILKLDWEPVYHHFAVLVGDPLKPTPVVYSTAKTGKIENVSSHVIQPRPCNFIKWSPQGGYLLVTQLKKGSGCGQIDIFSIGTQGGELEIPETVAEATRIILPTMKVKEEKKEVRDKVPVHKIGTINHPLCTGLSWDPTGRFICATVESNTDSAGYSFYNAQGEYLHDSGLIGDLKKLVWRPWQESLLKEKDITDLKQKDTQSRIYAKYKKMDEQAKKTADIAKYAKKEEQKKSFSEWRQSLLDTITEIRTLTGRNQSLGDKEHWIETQTEKLEELMVETTEEPMKMIEIPMKKKSAPVQAEKTEGDVPKEKEEEPKTEETKTEEKTEAPSE